MLTLLATITMAQNGSWWIPSFPVTGDTITIYFNPTQNGEIPDNPSSLVLHWGVNETGAGDWQAPPPSTWPAGTVLSGIAARSPFAQGIGGIWEVTIPTDTSIQTLHYVVNTGTPSSPGSSWGHNTGGSNWDMTLLEPTLNAIIIEPSVSVLFGDPRRSPIFVNPEDTIHIVASAILQSTPLDSLKMLVNGQVVAADTSDTLVYELIMTAFGSGPKEITAVASDTAGAVDSTSIYAMVNPTVVDQAPPPGVVPGINYTSDTSVILALFAPYKDFVYAIGDFNDWLVDTTYLMQRFAPDADSTLWWLLIDGLTQGTEYAFQYLVDGEIRVADPYTAKILDPWNDGGQWGIPAETYPNLKPYPDGMTREAVAVFEPGQTPFNWVYSDTFQPPPAKDLVIYELLLRDFIERHDYQTLIDTLDYLDRLGINTVEFMPINEFEGNSSWGYNPSFYFAPDKYYGPADALKAVIDECHRRGMAVLIDMVLNHSYGQSPLVRLYWNDYLNRPAADNPWYRQTHNFQNPAAHWGYDFNHESVHTEAFVKRVNDYWMTEFQADGFRYDFTKGFSNTSYPPGSWGSDYDAARIANLKRIADEIWAIDSSGILILEHLADNSEETELANYGMLLWGNMNYNYNEASMGWHSNGQSDFSWGYYGNRGWTEPHLVTYMESHDEERVMYKNLQYGNSSGDYDIQNLATAIDRMKLTAGFFLTIPGPKMIWQFGERGYDVSINAYGGRVDPKPPRWEYMQDPDRLRLFKTWQALLELRRENEVFRSTATTVSLDLGRSDGLKKIRLSHSQMNVIILGNFGVTTQAITPNFYYAGIWYEYFSGDTALVTGTSDPISLEPGELRIYTDQYVTPPEPGLLEADPLEIELPIEFQLSQNYPNPFNPTTVIEFSLPTSGMTNLTIHDLLGREVVMLINNRQLAGWHSITWNGRNQSGAPVAAGMYIYTLKTDRTSVSKKLVLLK